MKFSVLYPVISQNPRSLSASSGNFYRLVRTIESAGFELLGFADHPSPSRAWFEQGGHESFDPFVALAACAGVTTRLRLMTFLAVLPYRNPLLLARLVSTLDRLSNGRLTIVAGAGYLKSEFAALGVPFDRRNELFDEAFAVLRTIWADVEFSFEGSQFSARAQSTLPFPVQRPHPPIWIGGSSLPVLERVARFGQGWSPLLFSGDLARFTRSHPLATINDLAGRLTRLQTMMEENGRDLSSIMVQVQGEMHREDSMSDMVGALKDPDRHLDLIGQLEAVGVSHLVMLPPEDDLDRALDVIVEYGERIIAASGG